MKKAVVIIASLIFFSKAYSQVDAFKATEIAWYGIDFSKARLIGSKGFTNPADIRSRYFDAWNRLVLKESNKFDIEKFFKKKVIDYDTTLVKKRNALVDVERLVIDSDYSFDKNEVQRILNTYGLNAKNGVGLVFIVESFNKLEAKSFIYVTFFDLSTRKVLFTQRVQGEGRGFSMRNFWGGSILSVMERSYKNLKKWAKQQS